MTRLTRLLLGLAAVIVASAFGFGVVRTVLNGQEAVRAAKSETASAQQLRADDDIRINGLNAKILGLTSESAAEKATIAKLETAVAALISQLRSAGVTPVVTVTVPVPATEPPATSSPTSAPSSHRPSPAPKPTPPRRSRGPSPIPAPSAPSGVCTVLPTLC